MAGSFSAGLSGLNANSAYLTVIGNNLANINTIGFKASAVTFQDLVSTSIGGSSANPMQLGLGVTTGSIAPVFSQGTIENTRESTNVAIQGNGFFVVRGTDGQSYTRAGAFTFNPEGKLVSPDGQFVQGFTALDPVTGAVITTGRPTDIAVPPGVLRAPVATSSFATQTNLNASAVYRALPATSDTFTTGVQMYDALGAPHMATITYTKAAAAGAWTYAVTVPGADVVGGTAGTPFTLAGTGTGVVTFSSTGVLTAPATDVTLVTPAWNNGAAANTMNWDLWDGSTGKLTGFSATSATSSITQNGSAPGMVDKIAISADGTIIATFGAGQTVNVGQLAMASFNNPKGLVKLGSSRYGESQSAGIPNIGTPNSGGRGVLIGSALEQSNVDIAQEFTQMILAQRGYQANGKTITVSDEILVETLNLKR
jgi:flagellar hook protein FlgE